MRTTPTMAIALMRVAHHGRLPFGVVPKVTIVALLARRAVVVDTDETGHRWLVLTPAGRRRVDAALATLGGGS